MKIMNSRDTNMQKIETTLCVIEVTDHNIGGTSLEKAVRDMFISYDHALIREDSIDSFRAELSRDIDNLLQRNKSWKKIELTETTYRSEKFRQFNLGIVGIRFRPANNILI